MHYHNVIKYLKATSGYVAAAIAATLFLRSDIPLMNDSGVPHVLEAQAMQSAEVVLEEIEQEEVHAEPEEYTSIPTAEFVEEVEESEVTMVVANTSKRNWTDDEIAELIHQGYFTEEDFIYLTSVGQECFADYDGFYAVASCVVNRLKTGIYNSIREVVTAEAQFEGFMCPVSSFSGYAKYCTQEVKDAAVNILLGGESSVGNSYYFRGRVNGKDMWADPGISEFYVWSGNVFYTMEDDKSGYEVHNDYGETSPANGILIFDNSESQWKYPSGTHYTNNGGSNAE